MPAPCSGRVGDQRPTTRVATEGVKTFGPLACRLAEAYDLPPHEWQSGVLDDWLQADEDGVLVNTLCLLTTPRQNGKTGVIVPRETIGLVVRGEKIIHTSQEFQTAQVAFNRLRVQFGDRAHDPRAVYPELNALVKRYTTSANQMVLDLVNGGHIEFRTRGSRGSMGRGGTFDLVVVDEAQCYTDEQDAALSALNAAAPGGSPQTILLGTVPNPEKPHEGEVFARLRNSIIADARPGQCLHEWGVDKPPADPFDEDAWYAANPSLGMQLLTSAIAKDAASMAPDAFARERLGWWPSATGVTPAVGEAAWAVCCTVDPPREGGRVAYAVKFDSTGAVGCLAACRAVDGLPPHVELVGVFPCAGGVAQLAAWLRRVDKGRPIIVDGMAWSDALIRALAGAPCLADTRKARTTDLTGGCSTFADAVLARAVTHIAQPDLDAAVGLCPKRKVGKTGGWGFGPVDGATPEAAEAAALAYWAATTEPKSKRPTGGLIA